MSERTEPTRDLFTCPKCGARAPKRTLATSGYTCRSCSLETAHLELSTNGSVLRVLGWLRSPGEVLASRYRISTVLGKGGFGATYLVEDMRLNGKRRALKEIPRFYYDEQEMLLLSVLHHAAIPDICDAFEADDMVCLVLEFGGDRSLESERRTRGGRIPVDELLRWMDELCAVLSHLHGRRPPIVHRDLKPANILLDENDRVMLIDFGIAKQATERGGTRTTARAASVGFSPPEQVLGTGTDERSDVYALGATMYALATGTIPPPSHERLTGAVLREPRSVVRSIPVWLEAVIVKALELKPRDRHRSVEDLRTALAGGRGGVEDDIDTELGTDPRASASGVRGPAHVTAGRARFGVGRVVSVGAATLVAAVAVLVGAAWLPDGWIQGSPSLGKVVTAATPTPSRADEAAVAMIPPEKPNAAEPGSEPTRSPGASLARGTNLPDAPPIPTALDIVRPDPPDAAPPPERRVEIPAPEPPPPPKMPPAPRSKPVWKIEPKPAQPR